MANLLNLKINLKLNGNALNIDSGNMTQAQLINAIKNIDPTLIQYLTDEQVNTIKVKDVLEKLDWSDLNPKEINAIVEYLTTPPTATAPLINPNSYHDYDEEIGKSADRTPSDNTGAESFLAKMSESAAFDTSKTKVYLNEKDAMDAFIATASEFSKQGTIPVLTINSDTNRTLADAARSPQSSDAYDFLSTMGFEVISNSSEDEIYKLNGILNKDINGSIVPIYTDYAEVTPVTLNEILTIRTKAHLGDFDFIVYMFNGKCYAPLTVYKAINSALTELDSDGEDMTQFESEGIIENGTFIGDYNNPIKYINYNGVHYKLTTVNGEVIYKN